MNTCYLIQLCVNQPNAGVLDPSVVVGGRWMGRDAVGGPKKDEEKGRSRVELLLEVICPLWSPKGKRDRSYGQPSRWTPYFVLMAPNRLNLHLHIVCPHNKICSNRPRGEWELTLVNDTVGNAFQQHTRFLTSLKATYSFMWISVSFISFFLHPNS